MAPMPGGVNPETVQGRGSRLVSSAHENPLPVLVEIKFWNRKDLLSDDLMAEAFDSVVGEKAATTLIKGTEEEKKEALQQWLR